MYSNVWLGNDERQKIVNNEYFYFAMKIMYQNDLRYGRIVLFDGKTYHINDYYITE